MSVYEVFMVSRGADVVSSVGLESLLISTHSSSPQSS